MRMLAKEFEEKVRGNQSLPDDVTVEGSVYLETRPQWKGTGDREGEKDEDYAKVMLIVRNLPKKLTIEGAFDLTGSTILKWPDELVVDGTFKIRDTNTDTLPKKADVKGAMILRGTKLKKMAGDINVGRGLDQRDTNITNVKNIKVAGKRRK